MNFKTSVGLSLMLEDHETHATFFFPYSSGENGENNDIASLVLLESARFLVEAGYMVSSDGKKLLGVVDEAHF